MRTIIVVSKCLCHDMPGMSILTSLRASSIDDIFYSDYYPFAKPITTTPRLPSLVMSGWPSGNDCTVWFCHFCLLQRSKVRLRGCLRCFFFTVTFANWDFFSPIIHDWPCRLAKSMTKSAMLSVCGNTLCRMMDLNGCRKCQRSDISSEIHAIYS
jgi:hypothetical protein